MKFLNVFILNFIICFSVDANENIENIFNDVRNGKINNSKALNKYNIDVNLADKYGNLFIHYASYRGNYELVEYLIRKKSKINVVSTRARGFPPLSSAISIGHYDICKLLLENGANPNFSNAKGKTPLMVAAEYAELDIVKLLISYNADILTKDKYNKSALYYANRGIDNTREYEKNYSNYINISIFLIENGAGSYIQRIFYKLKIPHNFVTNIVGILILFSPVLPSLYNFLRILYLEKRKRRSFKNNYLAGSAASFLVTVSLLVVIYNIFKPKYLPYLLPFFLIGMAFLNLILIPILSRKKI